MELIESRVKALPGLHLNIGSGEAFSFTYQSQTLTAPFSPPVNFGSTAMLRTVSSTPGTRVFPAMDITKSGTRKEELLLPKEELTRVSREEIQQYHKGQDAGH